jgi:hypothetical protein
MKTVYYLLLVSILTACVNDDTPKDVQDNERKKEFSYNKIESLALEEQGGAGSQDSYSWESDNRGNNSYDYEQYNDVEDAGLIYYNYADENFTEESSSAAYRFKISDANASLFSSPATNSIQPNNAAVPNKDATKTGGESQIQQQQTEPQKSLKIIKDGSMTVKTKNIDSSKFNVDKLIHACEGYYQTEKLEHFDQRSVYNLTIRVPSGNYDRLLSGIEKGKDSIEFKNITAMDVTEEYNDVITQLNNKKAYLNRYLQLLSQAKNVKEILMIEDHIRPLQSDIERHIGRLRFLDDKVGYSTLNILLYQQNDTKEVVVDKEGFWFRLGKSFKSGWAHVVNFILGLISIWPQILFFGGLFLFIRSRRHRILAWLKK